MAAVNTAVCRVEEKERERSVKSKRERCEEKEREKQRGTKAGNGSAGRNGQTRPTEDEKEGWIDRQPPTARFADRVCLAPVCVHRRLARKFQDTVFPRLTTPILRIW